MSTSMPEIIEHVRGHRAFSHPVFMSWAKNNPAPEVIGALFHQIQSFCSATRPGWNFPAALRAHDLVSESTLLAEIVESEENHGPELATMAGYILNRAAARAVCEDLTDQAAVEATLKKLSDDLLAALPGYDPVSGLTRQTRQAMAVFDRRKMTDRESTLRNLGTAIALEMISNRHLIPGEKLCLVDSGLYGVELSDPEMHYLLEHWGEVGAEQQHELNAIAAVSSVLDDESEPQIMAGIDDFLDSLAAMWDLLDAALLQSEAAERELALAGAPS
jgi:hypothetical protein